jgi:predicted dehydrogenase
MSDSAINVGVVGVGYLGKFHAEKYAASAKANLVAVVDTDEARAKEIGAAVGVGAATDYRGLFGRLEGVVKSPKFVECHRLAPFIERGTDVDVVLDLMIHDIDVIASLVRSPVVRVEAVGVPVLTDKPDIANARITFANGCIANVTSSRVSLKRERKVRFFQSDAYISIDYDQRRAQIYHKPAPGAGWLDIRAENIEITDGDALADEIDSFLDCVAARTMPLVGGAEALLALEIASLISKQL